jgi:hypothetical protein
MPDMTHLLNMMEHDIMGWKEKKFMKCIKLYAVGDGLGIIFKNQVVEAECTQATMLVKNEFYSLKNFTEASAIEKLQYYNRRNRGNKESAV